MLRLGSMAKTGCARFMQKYLIDPEGFELLQNMESIEQFMIDIKSASIYHKETFKGNS